MPDDVESHITLSPPDAHRRRFGHHRQPSEDGDDADDGTASAPTVRAPASPVRQSHERYRPKTSPFSSPRKKGALYREYNTAPAPQPPAFTSRLSKSNVATHPSPRPCPDDCRCSDREVEMGLCTCAAGTSGTATSSSNPSSGDDTQAEKMRARQQATRASRQTPSRDAARSRAAYVAALASSEHMLPSSSDTDVEAEANTSSSRRMTASATPRRIQVRTSSTPATVVAQRTAPVSSREAYDERSSSDSILGDEADEAGPSGVSYSRISEAGRPALNQAVARARRRLSQPLAQEASPAPNLDEASDEEPEVRKRRRREERERQVRQRMEARKAREAAAAAAAATPRAPTVTHAPSAGDEANESLAASKSRKRGFDEDVSRLHRISHPPSANSIAAFAAQVSPPKAGHSRIRHLTAASDSTSPASSAKQESSTSILGLETGKPAGRSPAPPNRSPYRPELDLPPLPSASADNASTSQQLQDGIELLTKQQMERRRKALIEEADEEENDRLLSPPTQSRSSHSSPSPTGFSFAPQRMSTDIESVHSSPNSPRRNGHRRRRLESEVVSSNARLPANSSFEARQRLERALRSPLRGADEDLPKAVEPSEPAAPEEQSQTVANIPTPKSSMQASADSNNSSGSTSRKSVRFSERTETIESIQITPFDSDDEDEDGEDAADSEDEGNGDADASTGTLMGPSSGSANTTLQSRGQQIDLDKAMEAMERQEANTTREESRPAPPAAASSSSPNGPLGTPIRLPPGAFGTPFRLTGPTDLQEGTASFSRHVLRLNHKRTLDSDEPARQRGASEPLNHAPALGDSPSQSHLQSPMMPGGLRIRSLPTARAAAASASPHRSSPPLRPLFGRLNARRSATAPATDRGLPPSYSAIMPPSPSHSISHSTSMDSSLGVLQEGDEEEEEGESNEGHGSNDLGARRHRRTASHPLQSTPPPSPKRPQPGLAGQRAARPRTSLSDVVPWTPIEDLGEIASPPDSRSASPHREADAGSDPGSETARDDLPGTGTLSASDPPPDHGRSSVDDDSIRVTLKKVMSTLKEKYPPLTAIVRPIETQDTTREMRSAKAARDAAVREKAAMQARLSELKAETETLQKTLSAEQDLDLQQKSHLQSAQSRLVTQLESLGLSVKSGSSVFLGPHEESAIQVRRPRLGVAGSWLLLQVLILWLSLVAMRRGADHLFRCTYYDPFYPHIYDLSVDELGLGFGLPGSLASQASYGHGQGHLQGRAPPWGSMPSLLGGSASSPYTVLVGHGAASVAGDVAGLCLRLVSALVRIPVLSLRLVGLTRHRSILTSATSAFGGDGAVETTLDLHSWTSLARFLRAAPLRVVCALVKTLEEAVSDPAIIGSGAGMSAGRIAFPV